MDDNELVTNELEVIEIAERKPFTGIALQVSSDNMIGQIKLNKSEDTVDGPTKEEIMEALSNHKITFGIKESLVEKLAEKPVYGLNLEIARGVEPLRGKDGEVILSVKKDKDYKPEYNEEGTVDYKSINYFQVAQKGQVLGVIIAAESGTDGMNIFSGKVSAYNGRNPNIPTGQNTALNDEKTEIIAQSDGLIKYNGERIDISEILNINGNVDILTGNIDFTGDVSVGGDVCSGFSVKAGGNIIVKGVVEEADLFAYGSIHIIKGINGIGKEAITCGGDLTCKYIENAAIKAGGSIYTDYIIDSRVECHGDIDLTGSKEVLFGGEIKISGNLKAREIGNQGERPTKIEVMGIELVEREKLDGYQKERTQCKSTHDMLLENTGRIASVIDKGLITPEVIEQLQLLQEQVKLLEDKITLLNSKIATIENNVTVIYNGTISCKKNIFTGVKIYFGEMRVKSEEYVMYNCRIFWQDGQIIHVGL